MIIILAELLKENKVHSKKGMPVLMDVPYLGNLFSRTSDSITSTEIVILITPHIIKGNTDYAKIEGTIKPTKKYDANFKVKEPAQNITQPPVK